MFSYLVKIHTSKGGGGGWMGGEIQIKANLRKIWVQKILCPKKFWVQKKFWSIENFGQKNFRSKIIFGPKQFLVQEI